MTQYQTIFSRILTIKLIMANLVWNRQTIGAPIVYCIVLKNRVPGNDASSCISYAFSFGTPL